MDMNEIKNNSPKRPVIFYRADRPAGTEFSSGAVDERAECSRDRL